MTPVAAAPLAEDELDSLESEAEEPVEVAEEDEEDLLEERVDPVAEVEVEAPLQT